ncbi:hypothetical protein MASR2M69_06540 [Bacteroidota bacterium]
MAVLKLNVPSDKNILAFLIGGEKRQKRLTSPVKTVINVTLEDDEMSINQVVVTGIFNKSRESYTGSLTSISDKELKASGNRNILISIRNIDPSFNITDNLEFGSDPNKMPDITIRGVLSMDVNVRNLQEESSVQSNCKPSAFYNGWF